MHEVWEKNTADLLSKADSPRSSVSKMSKVMGLRGGLFGNKPSQNEKVASFTMEELMRKIRRIEKMTERMSQGKFGDDATKGLNSN